MKKLILLAIFGLFLSFTSKAQLSPKDSTLRITLVKAGVSFHLPGADLLKRFGPSFMIELGVERKLPNYLLWDISGGYIFGNTMNETGILKNISTSSGGLINESGIFGVYSLFERGFTVTGNIGKLFPYGPNPNSGFVIKGGAGFLQHKIRIESNKSFIPQITGDYRKGYDRLSNGMTLHQTFGYQYLSDNRMVNVFFGLDFYQAFTQNRRSINFDTMKRDDSKRIDLLSGLRLNWILPLYKKSAKDYFYF